MREQRISCVVVCDDERPIGVISERDLVAELARTLTDGEVTTRLARDVMSSPLVTTTTGATIAEAMHQMLARRVRRLPVMSDKGVLLGVVTQSDLLRGEAAAHEQRSDYLEETIGRRTKDLADVAERLRETNRQRGEFLATMSHEIRTPLSAILGTVELLLDAPVEGNQRESLETIAMSGRTLLGILNDVLDLSKIDAGELGIDEEPFELAAVPQQVVRLLSARALERGNELSVRIEEGVPARVVGDAIRLQQVLGNFVSNAVKFTEDGYIDLVISSTPFDEERSRILFEVRDTGMGMKTVDVERVFLPYHQAEGDAEQRAKGTGLGLTICQRLVELMGGRIGARSKRHSGSVFWMELVLDCADAVAVPEPIGPDSVAGKRALVVDDDTIGRKVTARLLERLGCTVDVACDGLEAVQVTATEHYDVVFMDCEMPVLDGFEATREIRRREATTGRYQRVVAMTGHALVGARRACLEAGMDDYVSKPASRAVLSQAILRGAAASDEPRKGAA